MFLEQPRLLRVGQKLRIVGERHIEHTPLIPIGYHHSEAQGAVQDLLAGGSYSLQCFFWVDLQFSVSKGCYYLQYMVGEKQEGLSYILENTDAYILPNVMS